MEDNDFEIADGILLKYNGYADEVTIPSGVTEIGESAFEDSTITSVVIPDDVTTIGNSAFEGCDLLESITLPQSVTKIGFRAFAGCEELTFFTVPENVTELQPGTFWGCEMIRSVTLPDGLTFIGGGSFQHCANLKEINIPNTVTGIGDSAFAGCESLTEIRIPSSVTKIEGSAFEGCTGLHTVYIPQSVCKIDDYAFMDSGVRLIVFDGTKAQWNAITKGKDWNKGTSIKVTCSDSATKEENKVVAPTLHDYKAAGIPVKVTTIADWAPLRDLSSGTAKLVWQANYALVKRRIGFIISMMLLFALTVCTWIMHFRLGAFNLSVCIILLVPCFICLLMNRYWRKLLGGYRYFCRYYGLPIFSSRFLFNLCFGISAIFSFLTTALFFIFILILAFISPSSSSSGSAFSFYDRLGIPENIGADDVIEEGEAADEAQDAAIMQTVAGVGLDIDYSIAKGQNESEYAVRKDKIEDLNRQIKELEEEGEGALTYEQKEKLKKLKAEVNEAKSKLDTDCEEAQEKLKESYEEAQQTLRNGGKENEDE